MTDNVNSIFDNLKKDVVLNTNHTFDYSQGNGKVASDINNLGVCVLMEEENKNESGMNRFRFFQKPTDIESDRFPEELVGEDTLSCGNYQGVPVKNLTEILGEIAKSSLNEGESVVVFMFKNGDSLKGYLVLKHSNADSRIEVVHVCSTTVLDKMRRVEKMSGEEEALYSKISVGEEMGLDAIVKNMMERTRKNNRGLNSNNEMPVLHPCHNMNVILRLANVLNKDATVSFSEKLPIGQMRSLFKADDGEDQPNTAYKNKTPETDKTPEAPENNRPEANKTPERNKTPKANNNSTRSSNRSSERKPKSSKSVQTSTKSKKSRSVQTSAKSVRSSKNSPEIKVVVNNSSSQVVENNNMIISLNVSITGVNEDCEDVMFALLRDGKQVGDSFSSKSSDKATSVDLKFELEGEQDKLCKSSFKLDVQVKCGKKVLKREVSVTKRIHDALMCTSSASEVTVEEEDEATLEDVNEMFDLRNIHMEGNTYYYTQQVYNVKGNLVQGETINLPSDLLASMGINQTNFVMDEGGNYRYKPPSNLSTTDRKVLKERLRKEVKRELVKEYGERGEVERRSKKRERSDKPTTPEEQRRLNRLQLEKDKLQMKREKDERDAVLALEKEKRARENRLAKREDERYRDKLRMEHKQMEQQQQMAKAMFDAQRRQSGDKGGTSGADKAMMEQMMKMMRESKKGDIQPIIQEVKGDKKRKEAPVQPQIVVKEKPKKKKSSSKKVKRLEKQYAKMLKMMKEQKKLTKKPTSKKKISREVREMIIRKYKERRSHRGSRRRSRHGSRRRSRDGSRRRSRHGSRHHRKGSKGSKGKDKDEQKKHKHKKSRHGSRHKKGKNPTKKGKVANAPENKKPENKNKK